MGKTAWTDEELLKSLPRPLYVVTEGGTEMARSMASFLDASDVERGVLAGPRLALGLEFF